MARLLGARRPLGPALAVIAAVVGGGALAFAYTAGWLSPDRLTPARIVDALSNRGGDPVGHRRNHSKGVCFTGAFVASGAGSALSVAPMLKPGRYPVVGRFAIATGNPLAPDASGRVRSMAVQIRSPDGQEWRSGMNSSPVFPVATPQAFYAMTLAAAVDPATGKPDPAAAKRFADAHPESRAFAAWAKAAPWTSSYADQAYASLNAFRFVDSAGRAHAVRWAMEPATPAALSTPADLARLGPNFLTDDLRRRLGQGPLRWTLVATLAEPGDPADDATRAWPAGRARVALGELQVTAMQDEADGPCRDLNYDPLVLPAGIRPSDDPLLAARSAAYANSFDRRTAEATRYPRAAIQGGAR